MFTFPIFTPDRRIIFYLIHWINVKRLIKNWYIPNTRKTTSQYGEGIYIGNSISTTGFDYKCDNNIDEGFTTWNEVSGCVLFGDGINGQNNAGSFIYIVKIYVSITFINQIWL